MTVKRPRGQLDPHVIISYKQLIELLEAAERLEEISDELEHIKKQNKALRSQFTEVMVLLKNMD